MDFNIMEIGIYTKLIHNYSELENIKNDFLINLSNYTQHTLYYASQYDRSYLLCLRNSNHVTMFSPHIVRTEDDIETWDTTQLSIDMQEIKSQNSNTYVYGSIFTIPKCVDFQNITFNSDTIGQFICDETMITKEQALTIGKSIYSHWNLSDDEMDCIIYYTYPNETFPVYDFNKKTDVSDFQKIWKLSSNNTSRSLSILINASTGEIICYY